MLPRDDLPTSVNHSSEPARASASAPTSAWQAIIDIVRDFTSVCLDVMLAIGRALGKVIKFGAECVWAVCTHVLKPILKTLIDMGVYILKSMLLGSPVLWPYLYHGIFSSDAPKNDGSESDKADDHAVRSNLKSLMENLFGLLGGGIGALNFINHLATSYCHLVFNHAHMLGNYGLFGKQKSITDQRNLLVKLIFGLVSIPVVIPTVLLTNAIDGSLTVLGHLLQSWVNNTLPIANLLGKYGVVGKSSSWKDERSWPAILIYGVLSSPLVLITAAVTNAMDMILTFLKQGFISFGRNVRSSFNLLGKHGSLGDHVTYQDDRHLITKLLFGAFSFPFVLPVALVTNAIDLVVTAIVNIKSLFNGWLRAFVADFVGNLAQSFARNLHPNYHLLGEAGVFGKSAAYSDDRPIGARIFYGILSAPFVGLFGGISNLIDAIFSFAKHWITSWERNAGPLSNVLLGEHGVFGKRKKWVDSRHWFGVLAFGILSAPAVLAAAAFTNACDVFFTTIYHSLISWHQNTKPLFNVILGNHGVFGNRKSWEDKRGWASILGFGLLTLPLAALTITITNAFDCLYTLIKHSLLSWGNNLQPVYHILGKTGVMGEVKPFSDERGLAAKIIFGILTVPLVGVSAVALNAIDFIGAFFKHYEYTMKRPALLAIGLSVGLLTALPAFILRKTVKGLYDFTIDPIYHCASHESNDIGHILKGAANFFSLGFFSVCRKIFKACTGYSSRFGWPSHSESDGTDYYQASQDQFRDAVNLAAHGEFPGAPDERSYFRSIMRLFYGLRHDVEGVIKAIHDAFTSYASTLELEPAPHSDPRYGMHTFFGSAQYTAAKAKIKDAALLKTVENYLSPQAT